MRQTPGAIATVSISARRTSALRGHAKSRITMAYKKVKYPRHAPRQSTLPSTPAEGASANFE